MEKKWIDLAETVMNNKDYNFLSTNEHLGENVILLTFGGSHAYGTNVEGSDIDIRGIAVERPKELIGLSSFEQFENRETDTVIYGLRKVFNLLLNCNPNVIEMLGTKNSLVNKHGQMLLDNKDIFLSKKAINSFGGYATAQLRRLENALARDGHIPQPDKEKHILNSITNAMADLETRYQAMDIGALNLYIGDSNKEDLEKEILMNIELNNYPLRDFKSLYAEMHNIVKDYGRINHRNKKKDDLHLNKHAMHLIRLLQMGTEILEGKSINTYRENKDFLLDVRAGKLSYDEIFELVDKLEKDFKYAADNSSLPMKPDYNKAEELIMTINKEVILNDSNKTT